MIDNVLRNSCHCNSVAPRQVWRPALSPNAANWAITSSSQVSQRQHLFLSVAMHRARSWRSLQAYYAQRYLKHLSEVDDLSRTNLMIGKWRSSRVLSRTDYKLACLLLGHECSINCNVLMASVWAGQSIWKNDGRRIFNSSLRSLHQALAYWLARWQRSQQQGFPSLVVPQTNMSFHATKPCPQGLLHFSKLDEPPFWKSSRRRPWRRGCLSMNSFWMSELSG